MKFTKMHGLGNDFVMVDDMRSAIAEDDLPHISRRFNDRHFGVGGDGLILVRPAKDADFTMRMFNPDGSEAEMCGNGIRCFAVYVLENGLTKANPVTVDTVAGRLSLDVKREGHAITGVRVDMGEPKTNREEIPMQGMGPALKMHVVAGDREFGVTGVSMGNPHAVVFVDGLADFPVETYGPLIETHPMFPARTNVHFVEMAAPNEPRMRTWERGAGITLACGTGACAVAVACAETGRTGRAVTIHLPGGALSIEWAENNHVFMTGPATTVFSAETAPEFLA